jgi:hypothetical protein
MAFEFLSNLFSSGAPAKLVDKQLTPKYKLSDLVKTNTGISNVPPSTLLPKITSLAKMLETLTSAVGPFRLESAYRSQAVQDKLGETNAQAAAKSLHTEGIAADVSPTTMKADEFFRIIANKPEISSKLGEIAVKKDSLHISLPTPTKNKLYMKVVDDVYHVITEAEAKVFQWKYVLPIGTLLGLGIIGYLAYRYFKGKR